MILCVTLNPCLDKTLTVPAWQPGQNIRGRAVREVVGGKGNNVARALSRLGRGEVRPVTFLGGAVGRRCEELLVREDRLDPLVTPTESPTREILTVRTEGTDEQTAFFDPDPAVSADEADSLVRAVDEALATGRVQALTMSGSGPSPATHGVFSDLIAIAGARRVPTFLDTYGPALDAIWGFWPFAIQLNLREAAAHLRVSKGQPSDSEILGLLGRWARRGVSIAAVTDGPNRFFARVGKTTYRVAPPAIEPVNPIGSGDSLMAGMVDAHLSGLDAEAMIRHAVACSVANVMVWDAGGIDPEEVRRMTDQVGVEAVERP